MKAADFGLPQWTNNLEDGNTLMCTNKSSIGTTFKPMSDFVSISLGKQLVIGNFQRVTD